VARLFFSSPGIRRFLSDGFSFTNFKESLSVGLVHIFFLAWSYPSCFPLLLFFESLVPSWSYPPRTRGKGSPFVDWQTARFFAYVLDAHKAFNLDFTTPRFLNDFSLASILFRVSGPYTLLFRFDPLSLRYKERSAISARNRVFFSFSLCRLHQSRHFFLFAASFPVG